jgi:hypothetical protein
LPPLALESFWAQSLHFIASLSGIEPITCGTARLIERSNLEC